MSIYVGAPAVYGINFFIATDRTYTSSAYPCNGSGKITSVEIRAQTSMTGCEVAIFRKVAANMFTTVDSAAIGNVASGAKRTFGVDLDILAGDYIGIYYETGQIRLNLPRFINWYKDGDNIPCTGTTFSVSPTTLCMSLRGIGYVLVKPTVATNEVTGIERIDPAKVDANGNVTNDGSEGAEKVTKRGFQYGLTEAPTWDVHEDGAWNEGTYSLEITANLDPDTIYYVRAYADNIKGRSFGAYVQFKTAAPYWSTKTEIKAEATASAGDIAKVGGKKTLTINNHLIQNMSIAQNIANSYLADYKDQKKIIVVNRPIPLPYEIGDTIILKRRIT